MQEFNCNSFICQAIVQLDDTIIPLRMNSIYE